MVVIGIALLRDPARLDDLGRLGQSGGVDMGDPLMVAILLGTIALMLPAYILASLIVNGRGSGSSPRPRDGCAGAGCCCAVRSPSACPPC
jgi:hypothetical protein